jgi:hypothetical protein
METRKIVLRYSTKENKTSFDDHFPNHEKLLIPLFSLLIGVFLNRSLPAFSRARASSGPTDGVVGSAAVANPLRAMTTTKVRLQKFSFMIEDVLSSAS